MTDRPAPAQRRAGSPRRIREPQAAYNLRSVAELPPAEAITRIKQGVRLTEFRGLAERLDLPEGRLAVVLHINPRTLARRKAAGRLDTLESERVYRLERLVALATEMLRDEARARDWLKTPKRALDGATPLEYAETEVGAREVERLIDQVRHGVFA
jgi:putative toxin-antitoxin system antitoxin component (TIGR02293 family)